MAYLAGAAARVLGLAKTEQELLRRAALHDLLNAALVTLHLERRRST